MLLNFRINHLLNVALIFLSVPIVYFSNSMLQDKKAMQQVSIPEDVPANRYLYSGSWPASTNNDELVSNYAKYQINGTSKAKIIDGSKNDEPSKR